MSLESGVPEYEGCQPAEVEPHERAYFIAMERRIDLSNLDLDRAAEAVALRRGTWAELGLTAHPITWMDLEAGWPRPLLTERSELRRPMSIRLRLDGGEEAGAEVVLYAGGWADVSLIAPSASDGETEYVELDDVDEFGALLGSSRRSDAAVAVSLLWSSVLGGACKPPR